MRNQIRFYIICVVASVFPMIANATAIHGVVSDSASCPIPFATISISAIHKTTTADQHGIYNLQNIEPGTYNVEVSHIGYATNYINVQVDNSNSEQNIVLQEQIISLDEVGIQSEDMTEMILGKLYDVEPLKKQNISFSAEAICRIESVGNLNEFPSDLRSLLRTFLAISGYRKIFNCMEKNPNLSVTINCNLSFLRGKYSLSERTLMVHTGDLTEEEIKSFLRKKWGMKDDLYDTMYNTLRRYGKSRQKGKVSNGDELKYCGTYNENGNVIHILKSSHYEYHVVAGAWQIYRMMYNDNTTIRSIDCNEFTQGIYLPVSIHNEDIHNLDAEHKWSLVDTTSFNYE